MENSVKCFMYKAIKTYAVSATVGAGDIPGSAAKRVLDARKAVATGNDQNPQTIDLKTIFVKTMGSLPVADNIWRRLRGETATPQPKSIAAQDWGSPGASA